MGDAIACPLLLVGSGGVMRCDRPEHGRPETDCSGWPPLCACPAWREREIRRRERAARRAEIPAYKLVRWERARLSEVRHQDVGGAR